MRIALVGATGAVGKLVLRELLDRSFDVTAISTHPELVPDSPNATVVTADANDRAALASVLRGHDAVISAIQFRKLDADALVGAVADSGVVRYLVCGGGGSLLVPGGGGARVMDGPGFPPESLGAARAAAEFLERLRRADHQLDWAYFSPAPQYAPGPRTGRYRLGGDEVVVDSAGRSRLSYEDAAVVVVDELSTPRHSRQRFTAAW